MVEPVFRRVLLAVLVRQLAKVVAAQHQAHRAHELQRLLGHQVGREEAIGGVYRLQEGLDRQLEFVIELD